VEQGTLDGLASDLLMEAGNNVKIFDNLMYEDRFLKPLSFVFGDIRDTKKVLEHAKGCDVVILLAALVGDPACAVNPKMTEEVNYLAIKNICEQLPKEKHVIFMSTCSVYGANEDIVNEFSETNPLSCYASTKLRAEKYVVDRGGTIFRLGTVFGMGDLHSRIRADLVVNTLTIKAFTEGEITVNGGNQWRPIIAVEDIAGYIKEACEKKQDGIFNIAYKNVMIKDLADDIVEQFPDVKVNKIDEMYQDKRNYKVSTDLVKTKFDYLPHISPKFEISVLKKMLEDGRIKNPNSILYNNGLYIANKRF